MVIVFDCETIPDTDMIKRDFDTNSKDLYQMTQEALSDYAESNNGSTFLPLPYHKVVAISAVVADDYGNFIKVGDFGEDSEHEVDIISHFFATIERSNPKLVSFNGRGFDMPMLLLRAMKYNLSFPSWFESNNKALNKSKWENYRVRYSENFHLDLYDTLGNFGATRTLKLDTICTMANLPGKYDISGDQVTELFYSNKLDKIKEYCQSDTLNTYWLWLKYELLKGDLNISDYVLYLETMSERLPKDMGYTPYFQEAIKSEIDRVSRG